MGEKMRTIWKFPLERRETQFVEVPGYMERLDVQAQNGTLTMWCAVLAPMAESVSLAITIVGTGHAIPDDVSLQNYWRTVQDGPFVWHIFIREGVRE